jgi:DNA-binding GntR family transcriptional regulator
MTLAESADRLARQTAAKALRVLADEGLVRTWPGLGFFVV